MAVGSVNEGTYNIGIVRYNTDGSIDNGFDADGKYTASIGYATDNGSDILYQSATGSYFVGGAYNSGANNDFSLVKLIPCLVETPILTKPADNYPNVALPNPQIGKSIIATNQISNPANVTYQITQTVLFSPGFEVTTNGVFKTQISACSY